MLKRPYAPLALVSMIMAASASAQVLRPGEAEVLTPQQPRVVDHSKQAPVVPDGFAERYSRAGQPALMVFWNRRFSDQLEREAVTTEVERRSGNQKSFVSEQSTQGDAGQANIRESEDSDRRTVTKETSTKFVDAGTRAQPFNEVMWSRIEASFMSSLAQAKVKMLDRALVMRKVALDERGRPEPQRIEMAALDAKARHLVEVLAMVDKDAPFGASFRIVVKDVREGQLLLDRVTRAEPEDVVARRLTYYTTNEAGFKKVDRMERATPTPEDLGRQLAREFLRGLYPLL